jgi:kynurenine formamidase
MTNGQTATPNGPTPWDVRVIDLAHELFVGVPASPNHPPFQLALGRRHGDVVRPDGGSAANEINDTGGHVGTHIDALGHISQDGKVFGGHDAEAIQGNAGLVRLGIDEFEPMVGRGVLLDVAAVHGTDVLEAGYEVTAEDLVRAEESAGVQVRAGDAVLIRTGWSAHWPEPVFSGRPAGAPGPGVDAARWLSSKSVRVVGGETIAFEVIRPGAGHATLPVHRVLLVESGVHIIEVMDLRGLAAAGAHEFGFVLAPLKIRGATGSPVRPLALLPA